MADTYCVITIIHMLNNEPRTKVNCSTNIHNAVAQSEHERLQSRVHPQFG
jgi:hypothetical protein